MNDRIINSLEEIYVDEGNTIRYLRWITPNGNPIFQYHKNLTLELGKSDRSSESDHHRMLQQTFINLFQQCGDIEKNMLRKKYFHPKLSDEYFKCPSTRIPRIPKEFYKSTVNITGENHNDTFMHHICFDLGLVRTSYIAAQELVYKAHKKGERTPDTVEPSKCPYKCGDHRCMHKCYWEIQAWKPLTNLQIDCILNFIKMDRLEEKYIYVQDDTKEKCLLEQLNFNQDIHIERPKIAGGYGHASRILELTRGNDK